MICAALGALAGIGMADSWTGTLLDARCSSRNTNASCQAKRSTSRFMIDVNGTKYRLDGHTNIDVRSALRENKAFKSGQPVTATITGEMRSGRIHAHTVAVQ
jgi:hypothetical protein